MTIIFPVSAFWQNNWLWNKRKPQIVPNKVLKNGFKRTMELLLVIILPLLLILILLRLTQAPNLKHDSIPLQLNVPTTFSTREVQNKLVSKSGRPEACVAFPCPQQGSSLHTDKYIFICMVLQTPSWEGRPGTPQNRGKHMTIAQGRSFHDLSENRSMKCGFKYTFAKLFWHLVSFSWKTPLKGFSLQSTNWGERTQQRCLCTARTFNKIITPSCLYNGYWLSIFAAQKRKHSLLPHVHSHSEGSVWATWARRCGEEEEVSLITAGTGFCSCCPTRRVKSCCRISTTCNHSLCQPLRATAYCSAPKQDGKSSWRGCAHTAGRWAHPEPLTAALGHLCVSWREINRFYWQNEMLWSPNLSGIFASPHYCGADCTGFPHLCHILWSGCGYITGITANCYFFLLKWYEMRILMF